MTHDGVVCEWTFAVVSLLFLGRTAPLPLSLPTHTHTTIHSVHLLLSTARLYLPRSYHPWSQELVQDWTHVSGRAKQNYCDLYMSI